MMKKQILTLTTEIATNVTAIVSAREELKFVKGDSITAEKIQKLLLTLPAKADDIVEGDTTTYAEDGNREKIYKLCEDIKEESKTDVAEIEQEITNLNASNGIKNKSIKKLESLQKQMEKELGISPAVEEVETVLENENPEIVTPEVEAVAEVITTPEVEAVAEVIPEVKKSTKKKK